jgi:hypothetical protein
MRTSSADSVNGAADILASLPAISRNELLGLWADHFEQLPPKAASRPLLERAVAYALQERQFGGLSSRTRRDLLRLVKSAPVGATGKNFVSNTGESGSGSRLHRSKAAGTLLRPGMRLVREWQGRSHVVDVGDDGFQWNGEVYRSLSSVAFAITGTKWSGPRFFRL